VDKSITTPRGRFRVRPYVPEDEAGALALWQAAFQQEMDPALWRWKYHEGPYQSQFAVCTDEGGRILVLYGGIPYPVEWRGQKTTMTQLMDIMSHPDCRGSGLFIQAAEAFFEFFAGPERTVFYYGLPGTYHFGIGEKYLQYRALGRKLSLMEAATDALTRPNRWFRGRIERMDRAGSFLDDLWKRCRPHYPFSIRRDASFVQWRFLDRPDRRYEVWVYRSPVRRTCLAYGAFLVEGEKACMVDLMAPASERTVADFLGRLGDRFMTRGIRTMETRLPAGHFLARALLQTGFELQEDRLGIVPTGRIFHPALSFDWVSEHIYYSMGDGDLY
jgi:hypothetical protein